MRGVNDSDDVETRRNPSSGNAVGVRPIILTIKEPVKILSSLPVDTHEARSAASCVLSPILRKHRVLPIVILQGLEISVDVLS